MPKFHLTKSGNPDTCNAESRACPLGGEHYERFEDAYEASIELENQKQVSFPPDQSFPMADLYSYERGQIPVDELPESWVVDDTVSLPAGNYFIGDPCYTAGADDDTWQKWCEVAGKGDGKAWAARYGSYPVVGISTAYGDGTYEGLNGSYPVDAGMIGVVPEGLLLRMGVTPSPSEGRWVTFEQPFEVGYREENGTIYFGNKEAIETDPNRCEDCGDQLGHGEGDRCESCQQNHCEQCGDEIDEWQTLCDSCEEETSEDLEDF